MKKTKEEKFVDEVFAEADKIIAKRKAENFGFEFCHDSLNSADPNNLSLKITHNGYQYSNVVATREEWKKIVEKMKEVLEVENGSL